MARRFAAAHPISPYATAIFAYSPVMDNRKTDLLSNRANIWQHMDPTRTGILDTTDILKQQSREACIDQYLAFALEAQVVFVENLGYHVPRQGTSFATWMKNGIEGQYPNMTDFVSHISLLFPEVRPKGFLEIRSVDGQDRVWQSAPALFTPDFCAIIKPWIKPSTFFSENSKKMTEHHRKSIYGLQDANFG